MFSQHSVPLETMKYLLGICNIFEVISYIYYIGGHVDDLAKTSRSLIS